MPRRRRGRGEGAIFERDDGVWVASISLGYAAQGHRIRRTVYGKTKQEVQEKLRPLQTDACNGALSDVRQMTVARYLGRWQEMVKPTVQPNTFAPYERHCRLHLIPHLGAVKLAK